jgi:hypothetical protein
MTFEELQRIDSALELLVRFHLSDRLAAPVAVGWEPAALRDRTLMFHPSTREQRWIAVATADPPGLTAAAQRLFAVEDEPYTAFCRSGPDCEDRWRRKGLDDALADAYRTLMSWRFDPGDGRFTGDGVLSMAPFHSYRGL